MRPTRCGGGPEADPALPPRPRPVPARRSRRRCRAGTSCTCHRHRRRARTARSPPNPLTDQVPSLATSTRSRPFDSERSLGDDRFDVERRGLPGAPAVSRRCRTTRTSSFWVGCVRIRMRTMPVPDAASSSSSARVPAVSIEPSRSRSARHSSSPVSTETSAIASMRRLCFNSRTTTAAIVDEVELGDYALGRPLVEDLCAGTLARCPAR